MAEHPVLVHVDPPQDGSPGWDEVEQREAVPELPIPAIPVHVDGPVQTQEVPSRVGVMVGITITTTAEQLAGPDLRRKKLTLLARDADFFFGTTRTQISAWWPAGVPLPITHSGSVFVAADTTSTLLTMVTEGWAD